MKIIPNHYDIALSEYGWRQDHIENNKLVKVDKIERTVNCKIKNCKSKWLN
jgi:hypothetical protein